MPGGLDSGSQKGEPNGRRPKNDIGKPKPKQESMVGCAMPFEQAMRRISPNGGSGIRHFYWHGG
jgi:hypothetical protein